MIVSLVTKPAATVVSLALAVAVAVAVAAKLDKRCFRLFTFHFWEQLKWPSKVEDPIPESDIDNQLFIIQV